MFHCHDGKADCSNVLYIFSVRMYVYHEKEQGAQKNEKAARGKTLKGAGSKGGGEIVKGARSTDPPHRGSQFTYLYA